MYFLDKREDFYIKTAPTYMYARHYIYCRKVKPLLYEYNVISF